MENITPAVQGNISMAISVIK